MRAVQLAECTGQFLQISWGLTVDMDLLLLQLAERLNTNRHLCL